MRGEDETSAGERKDNAEERRKERKSKKRVEIATRVPRQPGCRGY